MVQEEKSKDEARESVEMGREIRFLFLCPTEMTSTAVLHIVTSITLFIATVIYDVITTLG